MTVYPKEPKSNGFLFFCLEGGKMTAVTILALLGIVGAIRAEIKFEKLLAAKSVEPFAHRDD